MEGRAAGVAVIGWRCENTGCLSGIPPSHRPADTALDRVVTAARQLRSAIPAERHASSQRRPALHAAPARSLSPHRTSALHAAGCASSQSAGDAARTDARRRRLHPSTGAVLLQPTGRPDGEARTPISTRRRARPPVARSAGRRRASSRAHTRHGRVRPGAHARPRVVVLSRPAGGETPECRGSCRRRNRPRPAATPVPTARRRYACAGRW